MLNYSQSFPDANEAIINNGKMFLEIQKKGLDGVSGSIDGVECDFIFRTSNNEYNERHEQRIIVCDSETEISRGSLVFCEDSYWLVITDIDVNQISQYAKVQKCNNHLTYQDEDGAIIECPCVFEAPAMSTTNKAVDGRFFSGINDVIKIIVKNTKKTMAIDIGDRFMFDNHRNAIYSVTHPDVSSRRGLIVFTVEHSDYSPTVDRLDLNVANHIEVQEIDDVGYTLAISGNTYIDADGYSYPYECNIYADGKEVFNKNIEWSFVDKTELANIKNLNDNKCEVMTNDKDMTGQVKLLATLSDDLNIKTEKTITIRILF